MFKRSQAPVWAKYGYDQVIGRIKSQDGPIRPENLADYYEGKAAGLREMARKRK